MDMELDSELDSKDPEAYQRLLNNDLLLGKNRRPGLITEDFNYQYNKKFDTQGDHSKWIKQRNDSEPFHPILGLFDDKNPITLKPTKSRNLAKQTPRLKKGSMLANPKNVMKMTKKNPLKKIFHHEDYSNIAKGHEHQEMLQPRPDLTIMVQPNKFEYVGWQNNGGVRFFIHRPQSLPTDPRHSIEIDNNVEAFINLEHKDVDAMSGEFMKDPRCMRYVTRDNLWFDLEVEIANPLTYTWDSCIHEWQAKTMFKTCKCLPHYYSELFDYWWNKNLRCNHHGLKCMALVNGKSNSHYNCFFLHKHFYFRNIIHVQHNLGKCTQNHTLAMHAYLWS